MLNSSFRLWDRHDFRFKTSNVRTVMIGQQREIITIENVHVHKSPTPLGEGCFRYWEEYADGDCILEFGRRAICGNVTIRNVRRHETKTTNSALLCFRSSAHIQRLYLDNVHQTTEPNVTAPFWIQEGIIETLVERDVDEHEINT